MFCTKYPGLTLPAFVLAVVLTQHLASAQNECCTDASKSRCGVCVDPLNTAGCTAPAYTLFAPGQLNCIAPQACCISGAATQPPFGVTTPTPWPGYSTQWPGYPTTQWPGYPTTQWPGYPTTQWPGGYPTPYPGAVGLCSGRLAGRSEASGSSVVMFNEASSQDLTSRDDHGANKSSHARAKRVVGGFPVTAGNLCYQVAIVDSRNNVVATGALVWDNFVLSSFSSVSRADPSGGSNLRVILGGPINLSPLTTGATQGIGYRVLQVLQNPGFVARYPGFNFPANDAALLRIENSGPIDPNSACKLCMPPNPLPEFRRTYTSGYGTTSEQSQVSDGILRRVNVAVVSRPVCDIVYRTVFPAARDFRLDPNAMCAGGELGQDTCNKDGGAPLVGEDLGYNRFLLGVSSWGIGCGRYGYPSVYTNVSSLVQWIQSVTPVLTISGQVGGPGG